MASQSAPSSQMDAVTLYPTGSGLTINLQFVTADNPTQSFKNSIQTAANLLQAAIHDSITINLSVGYGEVEGQSLTNGSAAADDAGYNITYSNLRSLLASHETSTADTQSVNPLPNTATLNDVIQLCIGTAEAKVRGVLSAKNQAVDGYSGLSKDFSSSILVGVGMHDLTLALGRVPGVSGLSLFRYTSAGNHLFTDGPPAVSSYFSID